MKSPRLLIDGKDAPVTTENGVIFTQVKAGQTLTLRFAIGTEVTHETVRGTAFSVFTRASDVVALDPPGEHVRLYQRDLSVPKVYPRPEDVAYTGAANYGPTQQKGGK